MEKKVEVLWESSSNMVLIGMIDYRVVTDGKTCRYEVRFYDKYFRQTDWKVEPRTFSLKAWNKWKDSYKNSYINPFVAPLSDWYIEELSHLTEKLEKETA